MRQRIANTLDALTQLGNALLLPGASDTNANESISGRCYRMVVIEGRASWLWMARMIDGLLGAGHCQSAYDEDVSRAAALLAYHGRRKN